MTRKIQVTPGKMTIMQARAGMIVTVFFLLFGLVFGFVVLREAPRSEIGMKFMIGAFFCLWAAVCVVLMVVFARVLNGKNTSLVDVDIEEQGDFESRLRKLEQLKQEGLITAAEYQGKRERILQEKW